MTDGNATKKDLTIKNVLVYDGEGMNEQEMSLKEMLSVMSS